MESRALGVRPSEVTDALLCIKIPKIRGHDALVEILLILVLIIA